VGVSDASYLTRFFRKQAGVAPSAFRASWRRPSDRAGS